ncbi:methylase involved in ubiquinone/menaquinone biosynthesis [Flavobacterium sp. 316]|uniref:SAM-dependent methyltransferase n=1 Tax=Flavobacterium sp. 316 TaxID=1603293 RepID=UPI0005E851A9|nr:class I SAM-dependent methyltransferase [Flavobacterium sp. 316]KIX21994.1 methylase involved in ubiquinone/menaquinone biosynthesis [Flavobacterium sp. 316]
MKNKYFRYLWYSLSSKQRFIIRKIYYYPIDFFDKIRGNRHKYVPSRGDIYTGSASNSQNFIKQSNHQLHLLVDEIDLKPNDTVLDIGSGIGRTAISLTNYLNSNGKYEGFDVVKSGVDWCNSKIGKDFSNFNFTYIPIFNDLYNDSYLKAEDFIFPYEKGTFDKIFSFSVFTHMQINEIQNYFKQINKVLKDDGIAFSTFFLYDNYNEDYISKREKFSFPVKGNGFRLMNNQVKSGNIAIHKEKLNKMMDDENLMITNIIDGFWKENQKKTKTIEYQDIVIFKKKSNL